MIGAGWAAISPDLVATAEELSHTNVSGMLSREFYRVLVLP
jgi:hypothetical protein